MLSVSVSSAVNDKSEVTRDNIDEIYRALGTYLLQNGVLPCPAPATALKSTASDYGDPTGTSGTCYDEDGVYEHNNFAYGMVPIQDLGLSSEFAEDGYGNKFGYLVYKEFTTSSTFGPASYTSGIDVENKTVSLLDSGELAVFAIISHGANKSGAFNANSATQNALSTDTSNSEKANYPTQTGAVQITSPTDTITFLESTLSPDTITLQAASSDTSTVFDDVIFFKSRNDLVRDFNAFHLIRCPAIPGDTSGNPDYHILYDTTYMEFDSGRYNQITVSTTDCPTDWTTTVTNPGRRCGAFGVWELPSAHDGVGIAIPCTE